VIRLLIYPLFLILFVSCKQWHLASYSNEYKNIHKDISLNTPLEKLYSPYKLQLDSQMNVVIGYLATPLELNQPESTLGNHISDIILEMASFYTGERIDLAVINFGGLRINSVPTGNLTIEQAYKIMPFDNYLATTKIKGEVLLEFFNHMASLGGWPISGANYEIKNRKAENIHIQGTPFNEQQEYVVALSDYLLNGGDNCFFLENIPYTNTQVLFRDAIIEYWKETKSKNESISVFLENRVRKISE
jgi:2',3'-cyclic-nucleotide 2'-phosphodiesterase (5'-nucleotidase family)